MPQVSDNEKGTVDGTHEREIGGAKEGSDLMSSEDFPNKADSRLNKDISCQKLQLDQ